jgi:hypothetical protein
MGDVLEPVISGETKRNGQLAGVVKYLTKLMANTRA